MFCTQLTTLLIIAVMAATVTAFQQIPRASFNRSPLPSRQSSTARFAFGDQWQSVLTAVAEAKPDDYQYGAVAAPDWVLPAGCVLVILTAAIPFLLKPGEQALEQQRANEQTVKNEFNKKQGRDI